MNKGKFIVIEGLDGSGTTTQLHLITSYLKSKGIKVWQTFEPTCNEIGIFLRKFLSKEISSELMTPEAFMYLYAADRSAHCKEIENHINNGEWVICDRYIYSSYAYQGKDFKDSILYNINERFLKPDFVFFIDTPVDECLKRIEIRGLKKELYEEKEILKKVHEGYMESFKKTNSKIHIIDGLNTPSEICKNIISIIG